MVCSLRTYKLQFESSREEEEYAAKTSVISQTILVFSVIWPFVMGLISLIFAIAYGQIKELVNLFLLAVCILSAVQLIFLKCERVKSIYQRNSKGFLTLWILIQSVFGICSEQINVYKNENLEKLDIYSFASIVSTTQFVLDTAVMYHLNWYFITFVNLGANMYFLTLSFSACDSENLVCKRKRLNTIIRIVFVCLQQAIKMYYWEKGNRNYFQEIFTQRNYLEQFKCFLKKYVPSPILLGFVDANNTLNLFFANFAALNIFGKEKNEQSQSLSNLIIDNSMQSEQRQQQEKNSIGIDIRKNAQKNEGKFLDFIIPFIMKLEKNESVSFAVKLQKANETDQNSLYFEIVIKKIDWEGKESFAFCFLDIGKFKELDEQKNKLLATVSHNLRTPLNTIHGNLEIAQEKETCKEIKKMIKKSKVSAYLLLNCINDLLDYSQISMGKFKINFSWNSLKSLLFDVMKAIKLQCKLKELDFQTFFNVNQELMIYTDFQRVRQVLLNLLGNAVKFTSIGQVKFSINMNNFPMPGIPSLDQLESPDINNRYLIFTIEDTGIGIKEENVKKLFRLFDQEKLISTDPSFNIQGVGLGLTVSNEILKHLEKESFALVQERNNFSKKLNELQITVESTQKLGSIFKFAISTNESQINNNSEPIKELPLTHFDILLSQIGNSSNTFSPFETMNALIVDDDPFCVDVAKLILGNIGIKSLKYAQNGLEAIKILEDDLKTMNSLDFVLMDCNMPVMDGFQATKEIRKLEALQGKKPIPIIGLTANVATADEIYCKEAGMNYYLKKPASKLELLSIIDKIHEKKILHK